MDLIGQGAPEKSGMPGKNIQSRSIEFSLPLPGGWGGCEGRTQVERASTARKVAVVGFSPYIRSRLGEVNDSL